MYLPLRVVQARIKFGVKPPVLYADASHKNSKDFNCIQRGHLNALEHAYVALICLLIAGLRVCCDNVGGRAVLPLAAPPCLTQLCTAYATVASPVETLSKACLQENSTFGERLTTIRMLSLKRCPSQLCAHLLNHLVLRVISSAGCACSFRWRQPALEQHLCLDDCSIFRRVLLLFCFWH